MQDKDKTKEQLIAELHELHQRLAEWEKDKAKRKRPRRRCGEPGAVKPGLGVLTGGCMDRNVVENKSIWTSIITGFSALRPHDKTGELERLCPARSQGSEDRRVLARSKWQWKTWPCILSEHSSSRNG